MSSIRPGPSLPSPPPRCGKGISIWRPESARPNAGWAGIVPLCGRIVIVALYPGICQSNTKNKEDPRPTREVLGEKLATHDSTCGAVDFRRLPLDRDTNIRNVAWVNVHVAHSRMPNNGIVDKYIDIRIRHIRRVFRRVREIDKCTKCHRISVCSDDLQVSDLGIEGPEATLATTTTNC